MTTSMTISGGCLCGAVRYRSSAAPILARSCWCRTCQYLGAGNATVNALFKVDGFHVEGETRDFASPADSGNMIHRRFCPTCGTPMFAAAEARPHLIVVRVGTLDEPAAVLPGATIWTDSAPPWGCINETLPRFPRQPPPPAPAPAPA
jgi:hypothetical protein